MGPKTMKMMMKMSLTMAVQQVLINSSLWRSRKDFYAQEGGFYTSIDIYGYQIFTGMSRGYFLVMINYNLMLELLKAVYIYKGNDQ